MFIFIASLPLLALYISLATCTAVNPTSIHFNGSILIFACDASEVRSLDTLMTPGTFNINCSTCLAAVFKFSILSPLKSISVEEPTLIIDVIPLPEASTIILILVYPLSSRLYLSTSSLILLLQLSAGYAVIVAFAPLMETLHPSKSGSSIIICSIG